jgi:hypothetical protein
MRVKRRKKYEVIAAIEQAKLTLQYPEQAGDIENNNSLSTLQTMELLQQDEMSCLEWLRSRKNKAFVFFYVFSLLSLVLSALYYIRFLQGNEYKKRQN